MADSYYLKDLCNRQQFSNYPANNVKAPASDTIYGTFTKTMPHDASGRITPAQLADLQKASTVGSIACWNAVAKGGSARFHDPFAAYLPTFCGADAMALISYDTPDLSRKPVPQGSTYQADLMNEVYAMSLCRDIPLSFFYEKASQPQSVLDPLLTDMAAFSNPAYFPTNGVSHVMTRKEMFRSRSPGDLQGPYLSQFLLLDIPTYETGIKQQFKFPPLYSGAASDYMKTLATYLPVANGTGTEVKTPFESTPRYPVTARDLAQIIHNDFCYEPYFHAAKIIAGIPGAFALPQSPYTSNTRSQGFVDLAPPDIMTVLAEGCHMALQGAWKHKWWNMKIRPEELAKEVELYRLNHQNPGGLHTSLINGPIVSKVVAAHGNALLWQCYVEGCPPHPSWPAGHATVAGCCGTLLKAYINPNTRMPAMYVPHETGRYLVPINVSDYGESQNPKVLDEVDKLISNATFGRDWAGVHYRSDCEFGVYLGEQLALQYLKDKVQSYKQDGFVFSFNVRLIDGSTKTISPV